MDPKTVTLHWEVKVQAYHNYCGRLLYMIIPWSLT